MGNKKPIGVFDSGIGGLTVVKALFDELPGERIVYLGDTGRCPYGGRSAEAIRRMAGECVGRLVEEQVKMVVMACNTATAHAYDFVAAKFPQVPFIGVVDPCVAAAAAHVSGGMIGVMGTHATVQSDIYGRKLRALRLGVETCSAACPLLVPLAEEGVLSGPLVDLVLEKYLAPLKEKNLSALILGCTHYPLFRESIERFFGGAVALFDSATWTAKAVKAELSRQFLKSGSTPVKMRNHRFLVTDYPESFRRTGEWFLSRKIEGVEKIEVSPV